MTSSGISRQNGDQKSVIKRARWTIAAFFGAMTAVAVPIGGAAQQKPASAPQAQAAGAISVLDQQIRLDRAGFSPGEIDGVPGANTDRALAAAKKAGRDLESDSAETTVAHKIAPEEVAGPFTQPIPRDLMEQSKLEALNYSSALEALGERFHCSPALLRKLNPGAKFAAGESITVPNVMPRGGEEPAPARGSVPPGPALTIVVSKSTSSLTLVDEKGTVVFHAPVTSGSEHDPLPIGKWAVTTVSRRPAFHYNPELFWDANPTHAKAKIPAGPNNPVGLVWIDLTREHYGIHGTPEPGKIGHTESHGCVRLTNWDALHVASLVRKGTVVLFEQ
ncbi:MAG TPA: L,D-transpeptidase [Vicinamibacterales bacterium]|nr:L,D-transpeptidase [Vicinamibacterales bacterium]